MITSDEQEIEVGASARLRAEPRSRRGRILDRSVLWSTSDPAVASISEDGLVRAHREGTATFLAHCDGIGAAATLSIVPAQVASVSFVNAPASARVGDRLPLRVDLRDARGIRLDRPVTWFVSDPSLAKVDEAGVLSVQRPGSIRAIAESGAASTAIDISLDPIPVARLEVTATGDDLNVGEQLQLAATAFDAAGEQLDRPILWTSRNQDVAAVDDHGLARGNAPGKVTIVAECEGVVDFVSLEVLPVVANVTISTPPADLVVGDTFHLMAAAVDKDGKPVDQTVKWSTR